MMGRTVGKYRIVGQLGRGASGTVYKAVDETLDREVAIKILNPDLAETDMMKRFRAEATTLAKLNHAEIATIYELFRWETDLVIAMEFVRGETLDKVLNRLGPMPPDRAAYLIDKILSALEYAHHAGIVHRDMKPANVMVTAVGGVKIMDFGIARVRGAEHMTIDGSMLGTPAYMPPEQVLGQEVDGRADLYSVGVVFYRLLTGALPFKAETAIAMLHKQISETPTPLHVHREGLPDWCETIVQRVLAKSPADRFQTAEDFREALGRATGMVTTTDLAKVFALADSELITTPPQSVISETPAIPCLEAAFPAAVPTSDVIASPDPSKTNMPRLVTGRAGTSSLTDGVPVVLPKKHVAWVTKKHLASAGAILAVVVAGMAVLAYIGLWAPAKTSAGSFPVLVFETKALIEQRERDAQLLLADGKVTVMAADDAQHPLHSVPFESVIMISYSRGRDPLWNSPKGRARVARSRGVLGIFRRERHWITLRTNIDDRFIVLWFSEGLVRTVLSALEERTSCTPQLLTERKRSKHVLGTLVRRGRDARPVSTSRRRKSSRFCFLSSSRREED